MINSKEYWDKRFVENWEENSGRRQTMFFCNISVNLFPEWLTEDLEKGLTFGDVGCAEGDCTNYLANRFPKSIFTGIDFSTEAIDKAAKHYPNVNYIAADITNLNRKYDVIYSSNTLEHFHRPLEIMQHLFRCSNKYVVILIPFQERIRFDEHFYTFEYSDFPLENAGFSLVYAREYDCSQVENIFWSGKQLLVIYQRENDYSKRQLSLHDFVGDLSENYNSLSIKFKDINSSYARVENLIEALSDKQAEIVKDYEIKLRMAQQQLWEEQTSKGKLEITLENERQKRQILEDQEKWLLNENYQYSYELKKIYASGFWKLALAYYKVRDHTPVIKHGFKALRFIKNHGFKNFYKVCRHKLKTRGNQTKLNELETNQLESIYSKLVEQYKNKEIKGVAIIPSAFPFDELYNQRTINLAKYLSQQKIACLFLVWQWKRDEITDRPFEVVYPHVYSIPMYSIIDRPEQLVLLEEIKFKYAFYNTPSSSYMDFIPSVREHGFKLIYDIMDDWEEFYKVGQAPWYSGEAEESLVLQSDLVIAVSEPLLSKFKFLRNDIKCIGNGFYADLLGDSNVSCKKPNGKNIIHIGYFGHLTESWFDWDILFDMAENNNNIMLHIIGYGASEAILGRLKKYKNISYYGKVKPDELIKHVRNWHVGIIPFKQSTLSLAVDPIKVYEYLYFGLPTVVTGIPHLQRYPNVIVVENDADNFMNAVQMSYDNVVRETIDYRIIQEFLEETKWEKRFESFIAEDDSSNFVRLYRNE